MADSPKSAFTWSTHCGDGVKDSEVSLGRFPQYLVVQRQLRHRSPQASVLQLQTLQASGLVDPETPYSLRQR